MGMCVESERRRVARWGQAAGMCLLLALGGCADGLQSYYDSKLPFDTPIDWWHQLQGGVIADERPPPPGVGDPYPNLGEIPKRPTPPDAPTRVALTARLSAERDQTDRAAARDPVGAPVAAPTPAARATAATPAAPVEPAPPPMARIEAAQAHAPAPPPPAPPAPPAPAAIQAAASPMPPPRQPGTQFVAGPVPALPTAPPAMPTIAGISAPSGGPGAPVPPKESIQVDASFVAGSAVLRPESGVALRRLATRRFGGAVAVLGGGDAASAQLDVQAGALSLAWRRARAMQDVLVAAGVPASAMRVDAAALARGGIVRLLE